jgi:type II secretory pathway component PulM
VEYRQRRLIAAAILIISLIVVAYLVFFTPSESRIELPTPTVRASETARFMGGAPSWTRAIE